MKRFEFVIKKSEKVIYKSIFSFSAQQYKNYLKYLGSMELVYVDIKKVVGRLIGLEEFKAAEPNWLHFTSKDYLAKYPEVFVAASLEEMVYNTGLFNNFYNLYIMENVNVHQQIIFSELERYSWECRPLGLTKD